MKTVIALIAFSDGELSMFKGEIRDIDETKAEQLIDDGYVAVYSASELPEVETTDEGKVLTVNESGEWDAADPVAELPTVGSSDKDKYLHTNASTGAVEWSEVSGGDNPTIVYAKLTDINATDSTKKYLYKDANATTKFTKAEAAAILDNMSNGGKVIIHIQGNTSGPCDMIPVLWKKILLNQVYQYYCYFIFNTDIKGFYLYWADES